MNTTHSITITESLTIADHRYDDLPIVMDLEIVHDPGNADTPPSWGIEDSEIDLAATIDAVFKQYGMAIMNAQCDEHTDADSPRPFPFAPTFPAIRDAVDEWFSENHATILEACDAAE